MKTAQIIKKIERKKLEVNGEYLEYMLKDELETKLKTARFPTQLTSQYIKPLEQSKKDILIGTVLGDGMLDKRTNGVYWRFGQGHKNRLYLLYIFMELYDYCPYWPNLLTIYDKRYEKYYYSWHFRTNRLPELIEIYNKFYDANNKKIIPSNVKDYLSSKVIAHWIMDDGGKIKKGGILLNTNSFKEEEVNILSEALNKKYEINSRIYSKKKGEKRYPIIYISKYDYKDKLVPLIKEHFVESMYYKLGVIE